MDKNALTESRLVLIELSFPGGILLDTTVFLFLLNLVIDKIQKNLFKFRKM